MKFGCSDSHACKARTFQQGRIFIAIDGECGNLWQAIKHVEPVDDAMLATFPCSSISRRLTLRLPGWRGVQPCQSRPPNANAPAPGRRNFVFFRADVGRQPDVGGCGALIDEVFHDEDRPITKTEFGFVHAAIAMNHTIKAGGSSSSQVKVRSPREKGARIGA